MSPVPWWNTYGCNLAGDPRGTSTWWNNALYFRERNGQVCILWQVECMRSYIKGEWEWNTEKAEALVSVHTLPTVPRPIIPLESKTGARDNGSHGCCLLIRQRGIQRNVNNHITLLLCCFFKAVYVAAIYFGGLEWGEDDPSRAEVNKITAHTGSFIPLIHHLLPAASCHTLSVLATENLHSERDFGEIKGKKQ